MRVAKHNLTNPEKVFATAERRAAKLPDEGMDLPMSKRHHVLKLFYTGY